MDIKVDISAEDINRHITEAIIKSAIGESLKEAIDKVVKQLSSGYNNPLDAVVQQEIRRILVQELQSEPLATMLRQKMKEHLDEEMVQRIVGKAVEALLDKI